MPTVRSPLPLAASPGPLLDLVRAVAADRWWWQASIRFDARERCWSRVLQSDDVDLWLLTWLPGQQTSLHDHGDSAAAIAVLSGTVEEVRAERDGTLTQRHLAEGASVWIPPGDVHDVRHAGAGPAVSLHAYSPRLSRMTYYELGPYGLSPVRTVHDDQPEHEDAS